MMKRDGHGPVEVDGSTVDVIYAERANLTWSSEKLVCRENAVCREVELGVRSRVLYLSSEFLEHR